MPRTTLLTLRFTPSQFPVVQPQMIPRLGLPCGFCRVPVRDGDSHGVWDREGFVCTVLATVYDAEGWAPQV